MKKFLKVIVALILALAIIGGVTFLIDCSNIKSGKAPMFAKEISRANDGGTIEYMGLGYKIIDFNKLNGYDEIKFGLWFIKYEDFEDEYKEFDKNLIVDEPNINEDKENMNNSSEGEENVDNSNEDGENINTPNEDGENVDTPNEDGENINTPNEDRENVDTSENEMLEQTGDENSNEPNIDNENVGNENTENKFYFNATIIGVNNKNLVVQALENEAINASSDMFSFKLPESDTNTYLIGQKVKIEYTGVIREIYPASIDVIGIEIIE